MWKSYQATGNLTLTYCRLSTCVKEMLPNAQLAFLALLQLSALFVKSRLECSISLTPLYFVAVNQYILSR